MSGPQKNMMSQDWQDTCLNLRIIPRRQTHVLYSSAQKDDTKDRRCSCDSRDVRLRRHEFSLLTETGGTTPTGTAWLLCRKADIGIWTPVPIRPYDQSDRRTHQVAPFFRAVKNVPSPTYIRPALLTMGLWAVTTSSNIASKPVFLHR
jgi:hypothetical protein